MFQRPRSPRATTVLAAAAAAAGLAMAGPAAALASPGHHQAPRHTSDQQDSGYYGPQRGDVTLNQVDLASDIPGMAPVTDPNLKNPWGNSLSAASPLWISNQASDNATLYSIAHRITGQVLVSSTGQPFAEPGLWGIRPGTTATGGTDALLFTAGINDEQDGLLGLLRP